MRLFWITGSVLWGIITFLLCIIAGKGIEDTLGFSLAQTALAGVCVAGWVSIKRPLYEASPLPWASLTFFVYFGLGSIWGFVDPSVLNFPFAASKFPVAIIIAAIFWGMLVWGFYIVPQMVNFPKTIRYFSSYPELLLLVLTGICILRIWLIVKIGDIPMRIARGLTGGTISSFYQATGVFISPLAGLSFWLLLTEKPMGGRWLFAFFALIFVVVLRVLELSPARTVQTLALICFCFVLARKRSVPKFQLVFWLALLLLLMPLLNLIKQPIKHLDVRYGLAERLKMKKEAVKKQL